jgi:glycosyltransferase involved in cell wall biosynthesis
MALDNHPSCGVGQVAEPDSPASAAAARSLDYPLTVVIPTLNEAAGIREAVAALAWADEVIVVDGGSTDGTPEIAQGMGARVLRFPGHTIGGQRNAGIGVARNAWILALDADERVSSGLRAELKTLLASPCHAAYSIRFQNVFLGGEMHHGLWARDWHVRLFKRDLRFLESRVHEKLEDVADVGSLSAAILHTPYRDMNHLFEKMMRYARWGAEDLSDRGRKPNPFDITLVPAWRFIREYFVHTGWRDGVRGLLSATLNACMGLMKYAYLYALELQSPRNAPKDARHAPTRS